VSKILSSLTHAGRPLKKAAFWLALILLLAALGKTYYWWAGTRDKPQYVTADVTQGDIERSVNVTGSINPRVTVQVGSYVSGTVKSLSCDFNTEVKAGQICAKIDPSTFQVVVDQNAAQLNSTRAQLRKDEAALVYAKAVFDRDTKLLTDGIVAEEIVDNDKSVYKQAVAQVDLDKAAIVAQEASLKSAVVNLGYTNIVSPVTGTVLTRNVDVGQTVASSLQTPTLFLIGKDLTKMQVDANVSEADVGRIKVDQDVTFSVQAYPDRTFAGNVKQIRRGPITVQNVVTYDVVVTVGNPDLLLFPGMTADAEIVTDSRENVLRIPLAAVRFTPERIAHEGNFPHAAGGNRAEKQAEDHTDNRSKKRGDKRGDKRDDNRDDNRDDKSDDSHLEKHDGKTDVHDSNQSGENADAKIGGQSDREHHGQHRGENRDRGQGEHRREHRNADRAGKQSNKADDNKADGKSDDNRTDQTDESSQVQAHGKSGHPATDKSESQEKRSRVWVLRNGTPKPVWITTGLDNGELVEVLDGDLKPGDKVIVNEVKPVEAKSATVQSPFGQAGRRGGMGRP
jgi:HlyD family secretion protein